MLHNKYFTDALVLHSQTDKYHNLQRMLLFDGKNSEDLELMPPDNPLVTDERKELQKMWASPKCFYKFQPLNQIRDYFGESFALYFAWLGVFNFTLIFPMIVGIVFFIVGVVNA